MLPLPSSTIYLLIIVCLFFLVAGTAAIFLAVLYARPLVSSQERGARHGIPRNGDRRRCGTSR